MNASTTDATRVELSALCARLGTDPLLVQGAGGNASWKDGTTLWVKASGTRLADASRKDIFIPVDRAHLLSAIDRGEFDVSPNVLGTSELRPSIETILHALLPHRVVVHLHAIEVLARVVRTSWRDDVQQLLAPSTTWTAVDYAKPGAELARLVHDALRDTPDADVVFLESHGVVVGADDVAGVARALEDLTTRLACEPRSARLDAVASPSPVTLDDSRALQPADDPVLHLLSQDAALFERLTTDWALYPDHVVFLGPLAAAFDDVAALREHVADGSPPLVAFVRDVGTFVSDEWTAAATEQLRCYADVLVRQATDQLLRTLTTEDVAELLDWDAEHYRQALARAADAPG